MARTFAGDSADTAAAGGDAPSDSPAPGDEAAGRLGPEPALLPGGRSAVHFWLLVLASATALGAFIIWAAVSPGRDTLALQVDDVCKLSAAAIASASCLWFGRRAEPTVHVAWMWVGASAFAWAIGEAVVTWYAFSRNGAVPFPSGADIGFLAALPLAAIGVLLFPSAPQFGLPRARQLLDSAIVAGSLLIVSWATALGTLYYAGSGSVFSQAVGLAYPIGDVIVATVGISVLARGSGRKRVPLVLVVSGLLCLTVGDSGFEYVSHLASFRYDTVVDAARIAAFLLIALALSWPLDNVSSWRVEAKRPSPWQVVLPYFFLAIAIIAAVVQHGQSGRSDRLVIVAGLCVVVAVLARQVLTLVENLRLAGQMQYAVTTLRANQVELVHYALHDPLTELPNRVLFGDRIEHALARRASPTRRVAVLLCDLDNFKDVNDTLGHSAGDEVLIRAAERMSSCVRPGDTVARIGGDEFAILIDDASSVDEVASVAARVCATMRDPFTVGGRDFIVHASAGIAMGNQRDARSDELLRDADVALYAAKDAGGDNYMFFEPRLGKAYVDRLGLQAELAAALDNSQLFIEYQPVVDLASGGTVGVEALLRWRHPRRGVLEPVDFLPVAESSGIVVQIGAWALEEATRQLRVWRDQIPAAAHLWAAVNVSARQLASGDLVGAVSKAVRSSGIDAESLHIELTESAVIDQVDWSLLVLSELKKLGVKLEIDDFGTGYSSLAYLKQLPIDGVKIDRVFVDGLGDDGRDAVIVEAVVSLAHALQLKVAAEGVETSRQVEWLRTLGCDYGQGFYWSAPIPAKELEEWLGTT